LLNSDFKYEKIQLYYKQPIIIGPLGERMLKWGKPLYNPVRLVERDSGNQTYFTIENTFSNLNFMSLYLTSMRRCNGIIILRRIFSRIPFMRKLNGEKSLSKRCLWNYFRCQQRNQCFRSAVYG
jgi:hypothetical protein